MIACGWLKPQGFHPDASGSATGCSLEILTCPSGRHNDSCWYSLTEHWTELDVAVQAHPLKLVKQVADKQRQSSSFGDKFVLATSYLQIIRSAIFYM